MMNFRYHLVSLVAVFLALAIGVVLGAGPLQTRISSAVDGVTESTDVDGAALDAERARADAEGKGVEALAGDILGTSLEGMNVVTVVLPGADPADVTGVRTLATNAGAKLVGQVTLTDNWDSESMKEYRRTLATSLEAHLSRDLPEDATPEAVIAYGLVDVLTTTGAEADLLAEILGDERTPLFTRDEDPKGGADAIVAIGARDTKDLDGSAASTDPAVRIRSVASWAGLVTALSAAPKGGVLLGDARADSSLLSRVRTLGVAGTSADQVGTSQGALAALLALPQAAAHRDVAQAWGVGVGASVVMPPHAQH